MTTLYKTFKGKNFEILSMNMDDPDGYEAAQKLIASNKLTFPVFRGKPVGKLYNVEGFPTNIFIDRNGNLRMTHLGFGPRGLKEFTFVVDHLMKEKAPPAKPQ